MTNVIMTGKFLKYNKIRLEYKNKQMLIDKRSSHDCAHHVGSLSLQLMVDAVVVLLVHICYALKTSL